jgi:hypothetical protein
MRVRFRVNKKPRILDVTPEPRQKGPDRHEECELYSRCNGIVAAEGRGIVLYALDRNDDFPESLLSSNQFHRQQWLLHLPDCKRFRPEIDWDRLDLRRLLAGA